MGALHFPNLPEAALSCREDFKRDGFVVLGNVLDAGNLQTLTEHFEAVFRGDFETGNYPDGWFWQEGTSFPHLPRHMANAWKCDCSIARYVLSPDLARSAALLAGWTGARLAQDTLWLKPPQWPEGEFHQDRLEFLEPADGITCWLALDDARPGCGTLQYVRGSHHWMKSVERLSDDGTAAKARRRMTAAATTAGVANIDIVSLDVPAGTLVVHNSDTWHGSEANLDPAVVRRAIGVHFVRPHTRFSDPRGGYIYGRYKRIGSDELDDSFFPLTWCLEGRRTPTLDRFCDTGELG